MLRATLHLGTLLYQKKAEWLRMLSKSPKIVEISHWLNPWRA